MNRVLKIVAKQCLSDVMGIHEEVGKWKLSKDEYGNEWYMATPQQRDKIFEMIDEAIVSVHAIADIAESKGTK